MEVLKLIGLCVIWLWLAGANLKNLRSELLPCSRDPKVLCALSTKTEDPQLYCFVYHLEQDSS